MEARPGQPAPLTHPIMCAGGAKANPDKSVQEAKTAEVTALEGQPDEGQDKEVGAKSPVLTTPQKGEHKRCLGPHPRPHHCGECAPLSIRTVDTLHDVGRKQTGRQGGKEGDERRGQRRRRKGR
jgi:hypothetical protein